MVVATRQPSEDKEFWHSEILKLKSGGVVSGAEDEELEPASSAGKLAEDDEPVSSIGKLDDEDSLAELDEPSDEDEPASSAVCSAGRTGKFEIYAVPPSPPPPKPG